MPFECTCGYYLDKDNGAPYECPECHRKASFKRVPPRKQVKELNITDLPGDLKSRLREYLELHYLLKYLSDKREHLRYSLLDELKAQGFTENLKIDDQENKMMTRIRYHGDHFDEIKSKLYECHENKPLRRFYPMRTDPLEIHQKIKNERT